MTWTKTENGARDVFAFGDGAFELHITADMWAFKSDGGEQLLADGFPPDMVGGNERKRHAITGVLRALEGAKEDLVRGLEGLR